VASFPRAVHVGMIEMMGMMHEGKSMANYPYLYDYAKPMLDELVLVGRHAQGRPLRRQGRGGSLSWSHGIGKSGRALLFAPSTWLLG
jgi:hypothetical protein